MRFFNNTSYKQDNQGMFDSIKHLLLSVETGKIESVELTDTKVTVFGIDCILLEHDLSKPLKVSGKIRWFDKSSGTGSIRLNSGKSCIFYACNVSGANSSYHDSVTNVSFLENQDIKCELSSDPYLFYSCGLTSIAKVA